MNGRATFEETAQPARSTAFPLMVCAGNLIDKKLTVLFADISDSTTLYDRFGNEAAHRMIVDCLSVITRQAMAHDGTLIKTIGDEILCTFPEPCCAMEAARAMQSVMKGVKFGMRQMCIRIGFHHGDVICDGGDVYGDTVNIAARVTSITRTRQILTTRAAVELLPAEMSKQVSQITRIKFSGKHEALDIFLVEQ